MTVAPITLPQLDATTVQACWRLGRGLRYSFQVAGEPGELCWNRGGRQGWCVCLVREPLRGLYAQ